MRKTFRPDYAAHRVVTESVHHRDVPLELAQLAREQYETLRELLHFAADQLAQYAQYSEDMRAIGRGFSPCAGIETDHLLQMIRHEIYEGSPRPRNLPPLAR